MFNNGVARVTCDRGTRSILASPLTKLQSFKRKIGAKAQKN